ncbi:MAG: hypothetical protein HY934_09680 [Candidatus Firestonebacteria bacterium]|nr:hypothetical protein [Candidatus Firestonebacteria bacterium]
MKCPVCGQKHEINLNQCENCGLIFSKFTNANGNKFSKNKSRLKRFLKFTVINLFLIFLLTLSFLLYVRYRRKYILFHNSFASLQDRSSSHIIITPIGNGPDEFAVDYVYISGKLSLKQNDSTMIPLAKAIICFEDQDREEKKEILSQEDGFYEISLKHDIYFLTISYPESDLTFKEKLDLRKAAKLTQKDFVLN